TGVGFLGAGAILHQRHDAVTGLTSAATVWVVAGLGMMAGSGRGMLALVGAALTVGILTLVDQLEAHLDEKYDRRLMRLEFRAGSGVGTAVRRELRRFRNHAHVRSIDVKPLGQHNARMDVVYDIAALSGTRLLESVKRVEGVLVVEDASE